MRTIILPGYSPHNKDWAYEVKSKLDLGHEIIVHEWKHWKSGSFSLKFEVNQILKRVNNQSIDCQNDKIEGQDDKGKVQGDRINIIAKSVGTRVAMHLTPLLQKQIKKVILCGIPTKGKSKQVMKTYSEGLSFLKLNQVVVFQNSKDPFASFNDIKRFIHTIDPEITVIEKPRSDHNYPYFEDFQKFLLK